MAARNSTIIAVPPNVGQEVVLRRFLSTLVERLDVAFGYRGETNFATQQALADGVVTLQELVEISVAAAIDTAVESSQTYADTNFTNNPKQSSITDLSYTAPTVSAVYVQSEVQGIADSLEATSDKLDTLLAALRAANILEV